MVGVQSVEEGAVGVVITGGGGGGAVEVVVVVAVGRRPVALTGGRRRKRGVRGRARRRPTPHPSVAAHLRLRRRSRQGRPSRTRARKHRANQAIARRGTSPSRGIASSRPGETLRAGVGPACERRTTTARTGSCNRRSTRGRRGARAGEARRGGAQRDRVRHAREEDLDARFGRLDLDGRFSAPVPRGVANGELDVIVAPRVDRKRDADVSFADDELGARAWRHSEELPATVHDAADLGLALRAVAVDGVARRRSGLGAALGARAGDAARDDGIGRGPARLGVDAVVHDVQVQGDIVERHDVHRRALARLGRARVRWEGLEHVDVKAIERARDFLHLDRLGARGLAGRDEEHVPLQVQAVRDGWEIALWGRREERAPARLS